MTLIDDYLDSQEPEHRALLQELRALVHEQVPEVGEKISWGMPTFTLNGNLVHIAAGKHHVGLYPGSEGVSNFTAELDELGLKYSKGAIQLPLQKPLPRALVTSIITFRANQQRAKG
ncbi:MAG: iron chaperone [Propioniciclava sp.]